MTSTTLQIDIENIKNIFKTELTGYEHINNLKLKSGINIKYYDPVTQNLSKKASVLQVNYFNELKKTNPMSLLLYNSSEKASWKIICKKYIIFRQYSMPSKNDTTKDNLLQEHITIYKNIENE